MDKVRVGIIGVGQIAMHHMETYSGMDSVEIVAAADINPHELQRVAERFKIKNNYTDFHEMLKRDDIQAVDVCLHNNLHAPATIAALQAGKHVYCEKPMAGAYIDAKAMLDTAKECDRKLSIQLSMIFAKETKIARRLIADGKLGKIYHARSTGYRRRGRPYVDGYGTPSFVQKEVAAGGALYDMGVYHISRILHLLGLPKSERIAGAAYQETGMDAERRAKSGYNVEELGLGLVRCPGGLTIDIIESWAIHLGPFEGSYVVGSDGGVRLDPLSYHTTMCDIEMNATFEVDSTDWRWHQLRESESAYDGPQQHWIAALQGRVDLFATAETALETMLISEGIYLSNKLGHEVTRDEVEASSKSTALKI